MFIINICIHKNIYRSHLNNANDLFSCHYATRNITPFWGTKRSENASIGVRTHNPNFVCFEAYWSFHCNRRHVDRSKRKMPIFCYILGAIWIDLKLWTNHHTISKYRKSTIKQKQLDFCGWFYMLVTEFGCEEVLWSWHIFGLREGPRSGYLQ